MTERIFLIAMQVKCLFNGEQQKYIFLLFQFMFIASLRFMYLILW